MKTQRLTRAESREQTRERLLEAARKLFVRKGVAATSVEDIAEVAGYTRGAFYSNFGGKLELLLESLRRDEERARASLQVIIEESDTPEEMKARTITYFEQCLLEHESFALWLEATRLACGDTGLQARIRAFQHDRLEHLSAHIRMVSERIGRPLSVQADAVAFSLAALCEGVQLFRMRNHQMMSDQAIQTALVGFFSYVSSQWVEEGLCDDHCARVPG